MHCRSLIWLRDVIFMEGYVSFKCCSPTSHVDLRSGKIQTETWWAASVGNLFVTIVPCSTLHSTALPVCAFPAKKPQVLAKRKCFRMETQWTFSRNCSTGVAAFQNKDRLIWHKLVSCWTAHEYPCVSRAHVPALSLAECSCECFCVCKRIVKILFPKSMSRRHGSIHSLRVDCCWIPQCWQTLHRNAEPTIFFHKLSLHVRNARLHADQGGVTRFWFTNRSFTQPCVLMFHTIKVRQICL